MKKIKLFCFPYAGGSAVYYKKWSKYLNSNIELIPVELAGRGTRIKETLHTSIDKVTEDVYAFLKSHNFDSEYMLFGHSMGTLIIYELMNKIIMNGDKKPSHIFLSGRYPPHIYKGKNMHTLPDDKFMEEILKIGGTPKELCECKELLEIFMPILKADYTVVEKYKFTALKSKWNMDVSVLTGIDDLEVDLDEVIQWGNYTEKEFRYHVFSGGHFFIHDKQQEVTKIINDVVCS